MKAPKVQVPQEDPAVKAMREAEQRRAEADKLSATQLQLQDETRRRSQSSGIRSLLGPLGAGSMGMQRRSLLGSG